jgi:REP element-mobilizing transposase RayT
MGRAMNDDDPIAYLITWTVYGTHLQGDERGWRRRRKGNQLPQPRLDQWRRERLKHGMILLTAEQRLIVEAGCRQHCDHRGWRLWEVNARSNHVHAVVTAEGVSGKTVRDQLKANCTRALREHSTQFSDRPVWTVGGDWECINDDTDLEEVCAYVREAQDRMEFK